MDISRSLGLARTILESTVRGERRQGRQKKRWEDNIREWTGLEFAKSQRAVQNTEREKKWKKLVVKSSVVPERSLRLRDRWGEVGLNGGLQCWTTVACVLVFVSRSQLTYRQVKSYHTRWYFEKLHPIQRNGYFKTKQNKQTKMATGTKCVGRVSSLTSTTMKIGQLN